MHFFRAFTSDTAFLRQILNIRWKITYRVTELLIVVTVIGSNTAFLLLNKENV